MRSSEASHCAQSQYCGFQCRRSSRSGFGVLATIASECRLSRNLLLCVPRGQLGEDNVVQARHYLGCPGEDDAARRPMAVLISSFDNREDLLENGHD